VFFSKPELETTYVFHSESLTQLVFLGGIGLMTSTNVSTVYELACIGADSTGATGAMAPVHKKVRGPTYHLAPVLKEIK
jgi:hypothetical protein